LIAIIGGGISGLNLGLAFWNAGYKDFKIYDLPEKNRSSRIAAGLFNPVTFRRIAPSWQAAVLVSAAFTHYQYAEKLCDAKFFHPKPLLKTLADIEAMNDWEMNKAETSLQAFLGKTYAPEHFPDYHTSAGFGEVLQAGYLDTKVFLPKVQHFFEQQGKFTVVHVPQTDVLNFLKNDNPQETKSIQVVYCRGVEDAQNGPFSWLPFAPVKGEGLTVKSSVLRQDVIVSKQAFVLPIGGVNFKLGSTYEWHFDNDAPTEKAEKELVQRWWETTPAAGEILEHWSGIRPATRDRRPFIGQHPIEKQFFLFNGMGSKAVLLSPYYAQHFAEYLLHGSLLDKEVNISRYFSWFK
jgi:glycine oxidase